ncbi:MAG: AmmeMemoRadiSam system protein B, partial [Crenarchaeota archaeon]|nr:AmmeMemoRadiSam system protein B [Thermoproteota archaeon]
AHKNEHSIEVQLPFLQYLYGDKFTFVPICFLMQDLQSAKDVGNALTKALEGQNAVVIASSDFSHYEPHEKVKQKDTAAIKAIEELEENQFYQTIKNQNISACGYGPIVALITYAKNNKIKTAHLLSHKTSGDIIGDKTSVVGYAALAIKKPNLQN